MWDFPGGPVVENPPCNAGETGLTPGEGTMEEGTATHSSTLAWRIPWTEEPGGLQSMLLLLLSRFSRARPCVTP